MTRLNFIIAGAQRSATTSLKAACAEHPEIRFLSNKPEQLSFNDHYVGLPFASPMFSRSIIGLQEEGEVYDAISRVSGEPKYIATKQPFIMIFSHAACNLRQHLPDAKIAFILRNPMDCAWSAFKKTFKGSDLWGAFDQRLTESLDAIEDKWDMAKRSQWLEMLFSGNNKALFLDRGFYYPQLVNFVLLYGWDQIHIINFRDFAARPEKTVNQLFGWLGLEPLNSFTTTGQKHNSASKHSSEAIASARMKPEQREKLTEFYRPSNRRLCEALGWDYDDWISA